MRLKNDPCEDHRLVGLRTAQFRKRHQFFELEIIADAFAVFQGDVFFIYPARLSTILRSIDLSLAKGSSNGSIYFTVFVIFPFSSMVRRTSEHVRDNQEFISPVQSNSKARFGVPGPDEGSDSWYPIPNRTAESAPRGGTTLRKLIKNVRKHTLATRPGGIFSAQKQKQEASLVTQPRRR